MKWRRAPAHRARHCAPGGAGLHPLAPCYAGCPAALTLSTPGGAL